MLYAIMIFLINSAAKILNNNYMEYIKEIIDITIKNFDFAYCISVNVLTYLIIKIIDSLNGKKVISTWSKRIVLLVVILSTGVIYNLIGCDNKILLNSAILAPVFWSWIMKPICKKFKIDYKNINLFE